jgi:hypothetical protein
MLFKQIIFIAFISNTIYGQNIVLDKSTLKPLSFVNIYEKNNKIGFYSSTEGYFETPKTLLQSDTLIFSFLGYNLKQISIKEINKNDTIFLEATPLLLDEITIVSKIKNTKYKLQKLGIVKNKSNHRQCILSTASKIAVYIPNNTNKRKTYIENLIYKNLIVSYRTPIYRTKIKNRVVTRLQLYNVNPFTNKPNKPMINDDIIITINKNGDINYDISKYNIELPLNGVFIVLEVIGIKNEDNNIVNNYGNILCYKGTEYMQGKNTWRSFNGSVWQNEYEWFINSIKDDARKIKRSIYNAMFSISVKSYE